MMRVTELIERVKNNDATLTRVHLANATCITTNEVVILAKALETNTVVTELYVSHNSHVQCDAFVALAETLKRNTTLQVLGLACTDGGDPGAMALANALRINTTLTKLSVACTHIGIDGMRALSEACKYNVGLTVCYGIYESKPYLERNAKNRIRVHKRATDAAVTLILIRIMHKDVIHAIASGIVKDMYKDMLKWLTPGESEGLGTFTGGLF